MSTRLFGDVHVSGSRTLAVWAMLFLIVAVATATTACQEQQKAEALVAVLQTPPDWAKGLTEVQGGSKDALSTWRQRLLDYRGTQTDLDFVRLALHIGEENGNDSHDPYTMYSLAEQALLRFKSPPPVLVLRAARDLNSVFEVDRASRLLKHFSVTDPDSDIIRDFAEKLQSANKDRLSEAGLPVPGPSEDSIRESLLDILVAPGLDVDLSEFADAVADRTPDAVRPFLLPITTEDKNEVSTAERPFEVDYDPVRRFEVTALCVPRDDIDSLSNPAGNRKPISSSLSRALRAARSKIQLLKTEKYIELFTGEAFDTQRYFIVPASPLPEACGTLITVDAYSVSTEFADLTGDGNPELIVADHDSSDVRRLSLFVVDLIDHKLLYRTLPGGMGEYFTANLDADPAVELVVRHGFVSSGLVNNCVQCATSFKTEVIAYSAVSKSFHTLRSVVSSSDIATDMPILRMNAEIDRFHAQKLVKDLKAGVPKKPIEVLEPITAMFSSHLYSDAADIAAEVEAFEVAHSPENPKLRSVVRAWRCRALARAARIEEAQDCIADKEFREEMVTDEESSFEYWNLKCEVALTSGDLTGFAEAIKEQEALLGENKASVADQLATYQRIIGDSQGAAVSSEAAFDSAVRDEEYERTIEPMVGLVRHFADQNNKVDAIGWLRRLVRIGRALGHDACVPAMITGAQLSMSYGYADIAKYFLDQALLSSSSGTWSKYGPQLLRIYAMMVREESPHDSQSLFVRAAELGTVKDPSVSGSSYYDAAMLAKSSGATADAVALLQHAASVITNGRTRIDSERDKFIFLTDKRTIVEELVSSLDVDRNAEQILSAIEDWKVQSFLDLYFRHGSAFRSSDTGGAQYDLSSLDNHTAFVSYFISKKNGVAVVAQGGVPLRAVRLSISESDATALVGQLRSELDIRNPQSLRMIRAGRLSETLQSTSSGLGNALIESLRLDKSITRLLISSDESLFGLPWPALSTKDGQWLVERASLTLIPSATLATAAKERRDLVSSKNSVALVVGALGGVAADDVASMLGPGKGARDLSPLSYGEDEAIAVSSAFKDAEHRYLLEANIAPQLQGERAPPYKVNLLQQLPKARWAHIVAHGLFDADNPMESSIFLAGKGADRRLSAREILAEDLRGLDLITLAACQTGVVGARPGGEPVGFIRALLGAGARSVVVTDWEVDDRATARLLAGAYSRLSAGEDVPDALRASASEMIAERRHPYFWGGISVYGAWPH